MTAFSLGTAWEDMAAFLRREHALVVPVALAVFGPTQLMLRYAMAAVPDPDAVTQATALSGQMLLIFPALLCALYGYLVVSLLVLVPGISVGEALARGLRAYPRTLATGALIMLIWMAIAVGVVIAATLVIMLLRGGAQASGAAGLLSYLLIVPMIVIVVRMLLFAPVLAIEQAGPADALRRIWALSRDNVLRFAGVWLLFLFMSILVTIVDTLVLGSLFRLLALGFGDGELAAVVQAVVSAAIQALLTLAMTVYIAQIYRRVAD